MLQCEAQGEKPIGILWNMNNKRLDPKSDSRYTIREEILANGVLSDLSIKRTERSDSALFTCVATNAFGSDDTSINMIVQGSSLFPPSLPPPSPPFANYELRFLAEVPEVPYGLKVLDKSGRSVQLSWAAPYDGNSPIKRYVIEYKISKGSWETDIDRVLVPGSQQNVAGVFNLRPATTYHLRIVAENEIGASDPSDTVTIITAEEAPSGPPTSIRVDDLDQHTLKVPAPLRVSLSFFLSSVPLVSLRILLDSGNVETAPSRGLERRDPWILRRLQALLLRETVHVRNRGLLEGGRKGAPPADHESEDVHPVQRGRASVQQSGIGADERGAEAAHRRGRTRATPSRHHLHHLDLPDHQDLLDVAPP